MPTADNVSNSGPVSSPNPFAVQAVQDADGADLVDVAALHEGARQALYRGRHRVRAGRPYLAVLVGEEGTGKSHLLWWLRQKGTEKAGLHVAMPALPDVAQPFRHALKQLVSALCRKELDGPGGKFERVIDRLMWEALYAQACDLLDGARIGMYQAPGALLKLLGPLCIEGGRRRALTDFVAAAQPIWNQVEPGLRAYLLSLPTEMSIDTAARAVLLQYPYADRKALCTGWLAGEDLSPRDREKIAAKQVINNESAAKYVLCALCRLLTGSAMFGQSVPLLFTYDQTDSVAKELGLPGVQGMAEVVSAIQAQGGAALQVLACRPDTFRLFSDKSARQGTGPLKSVDDTLQLQRPAQAHLKELVAARAGQSSALSTADLDPASWPQEVATPRAALAYLSSLWLNRNASRGEAVPLPAQDAPTAKGLPSGPLRAPAGSAKSAPLKAASPAVSARNAPSKPIAVAVSAAVSARNAPSKPIAAAVSAAVSAKNAPSKPGGAPSKPLAPAVAPPKEKELEPSASSPSITWMAMASGDEMTPINTDSKAPAKAKAKEPIKPIKTAPVTPPVSVVSIGPSPPSAQSPSVTWMAMAEDDDPLQRALAAVDAQDAAGNSSSSSSSSSSKPRATKDRLRALGSQSNSLREEQVLAAFGTRDRVEEWQLAQELGVSQAVLSETLSRLEAQGMVRLIPVGDGQRMVARL